MNDQNSEVPENVVDFKSAPKRMSKADLKKQAAYEERRRRLMNQGIKPESVDAVIAEQDYQALPLDRKIARLDKLVANLFKSFQSQIIEMAQQVTNINYNQNKIADAIEVNGRAVQKMLYKLGITEADFKAAMEEADTELTNEFKAREEAKHQAEVAAKEQSEKEAIVDGVKVSTEGSEVPDDATVFGG